MSLERTVKHGVVWNIRGRTQFTVGVAHHT
jgi:hypothetical protein